MGPERLSDLPKVTQPANSCLEATQSDQFAGPALFHFAPRPSPPPPPPSLPPLPRLPPGWRPSHVVGREAAAAERPGGCPSWAVLHRAALGACGGRCALAGAAGGRCTDGRPQTKEAQRSPSGPRAPCTRGAGGRPRLWGSGPSRRPRRPGAPSGRRGPARREEEPWASAAGAARWSPSAACSW